MKPTTAAQIRKEEDRKKRRAAERWRKWIEDLRRRQMQAKRDRRRRWLILMLLALLESKPAQAFFPLRDPAPVPTPSPAAQQPRRRKRTDNDAGERPAFDHSEHVYWDYSTRPGEHHLHVMDGLTYADIIELNRIYRPHLFKTPAPIPGMPARYADERPHIWTLIDHLQYDFLRPAAIAAIKLLVDPSAHEWIDACERQVQGSSWKDLRYCRGRTPDMTIREFRRAAERWREERLREAEEKKRKAEEILDNGPKPPGGG